MPVFLVDVEQKQLDMSFWTQKDLLAAIGALADAVLLQFQGKVDQRLGDVDQIPLRKAVFCVFLLFDGPFEGEIVVICVGIENAAFDA